MYLMTDGHWLVILSVIMCPHWLRVCSAQSLAAHWARAVAGPGQGLVTTDWSDTQEMALASLVCTPVPCTHRGHTGTSLTLGGEMTSGSGHKTASWISPKMMMRRKMMLHWSWSLWGYEWREWGNSDMSLDHRPPGHLGPGPLPCRHMRTHNLPHTAHTRHQSRPQSWGHIKPFAGQGEFIMHLFIWT